MVLSIKDNDAKEAEVMGALNKGNWFSIGLVALSCYALVTWMLPETMKMNFFETGGNVLKDISAMRVFYATIVGLIVGEGRKDKSGDYTKGAKLKDDQIKIIENALKSKTVGSEDVLEIIKIFQSYKF